MQNNHVEKINRQSVFSELNSLMTKTGMLSPKEFEFDKIVRFSPDGGSKQNGWYYLAANPDGSVGGQFGDWKTGITKTFIIDPEGEKLSEESRKLYTLKAEINREKLEKKNEVKHETASTKAREIWDDAGAVLSDNPYIVKKRIKPVGIKQHYTNLVIPLYDDFGDHEDSPISLQFIGSTGGKRFHNGGKVAGCFHTIGNLTDTDIIYVAEGYATGITIYEATDTPVVVAFNTGNLKAVCDKLKNTFPKIQIIIAADNDIKTESNSGHNSGREFAKEASNELGVEFVLCPVNSDFNDLFNEYQDKEEGFQAVKESLLNIEFDCIYTKIIHELNSQYAITWVGGRCLILKENKNFNSKFIDIQFTSDTDLKKYYANRTVQDPDEPKKQLNIVDYWLKSKDRRQYKEVIFEPGKEMPGYYNLWTGFQIKPVKGDWSLFREHISNIITNANENEFQWVMDWMARIVQDPGGKRPGTSIVLRGGRGTGKGIFVNTFGHILGNHYLQLAQQSHLLGRFNHHLKNKILVFADEGFWAGDKQSEGAIKNMITEPKLVIEQKGKDAITVRNCMNIIIASNNDWVVPAGLHERRFYVADVSDAHQQDNKYFGEIIKEMENGGYEAMLYDLIQWKYSMKNLREAPKTNALLDQIKNTMDVAGKFWIERLEEGTLSEEHGEWRGEIECKKLYDNYLDFANSLKQGYLLSPQQFGKKMNKLCTISKSKLNHGGYRVNVYRFQSLEESRKQFENLVGMDGQIQWDDCPQ